MGGGSGVIREEEEVIGKHILHITSDSIFWIEQCILRKQLIMEDGQVSRKMVNLT